MGIGKMAREGWQSGGRVLGKTHIWLVNHKTLCGRIPTGNFLTLHSNVLWTLQDILSFVDSEWCETCVNAAYAILDNPAKAFFEQISNYV